MVRRCLSSNPSNYMYYGMESSKRQTRVVYGWLVVGQSVGVGYAYGLGLYGSYVCVMNSAAAVAVCGFLWRYTSVICLCLCCQI